MSKCLDYDVFMSLEIVFILANRADPDEMPLYAAFHLGLHCLPKYPFRTGLISHLKRIQSHNVTGDTLTLMVYTRLVQKLMRHMHFNMQSLA